MSFLLLESKRDNLLLPYIELLKNNGIDVQFGQFKSMLLNKLSNEGGIRNLSLRSNYYLAGAAKYYLAGELTLNHPVSMMQKEFWENGYQIGDEWNEQVCKKLNCVINILRNSYIDSVGTVMELPEDFGEISLKDLFKKYSKLIKKELGTTTTSKKNEITLDRNPDVGNNYTFEIMYSQSDCQKYERPTAPGSWCITYGQNHYNYYVRYLNIHYVIFRMNGWENVQRPSDPINEPGWSRQKPHDLYGNSLIALLQSNNSPEPVYITSRWNHGYGDSHCEADHAYTKEEFQQITGVTDDDLKRIYDIWKADNCKSTRKSAARIPADVVRAFKYTQMRINSGESMESVFDEIKQKEYTDNPPKITKDCVICTLKINEIHYSALVDRAKIIFETISTNGIYGIGDDRVSIELSEKQNLLYSRKLRKLVEIDGVKVFKYVPYRFDRIKDNDAKGCFMVKQSTNDIALIDFATFEPIRLPNGQYWFNNLFYRGGNAFYYKIDTSCYSLGSELSSRFIEILYDASSGESYFFDSLKKVFFDKPEIPSTWILLSFNNPTENIEPRLVFNEILPNGLYLVQFVPKNFKHRYSYAHFIYGVYQNNKPVNILGDNFVSGIKGISHCYDYIIVRKQIGERCFAYSLKTNKPIMFMGEPLMVSEYSSSYSRFSNTLELSDFAYNRDHYFVDCNTEKLYRNINYDGISDIDAYKFRCNLSTENQSSVPMVWLYDSNYDRVEKPLSEFGVLDGEQEQNTNTINSEDIQNMVSESLNKILKKLFNGDKITKY